MIARIKDKIHCLLHGHDFRFDGVTLGGSWILCRRCHKLDEYLPGVHEPQGFKK